MSPRPRACSTSSPAHLVELARRGRRLRRAGPEALVVVVEVREVDHQQVEVLRVEQQPRRGGDPARRRDARRRPPVREERELAERTGQAVVQLGRVGVAVGRLAPVGVVDRPRGDREVGRRAHRVPPADVRGPEAGPRAPRRLPQLLALHEPVVLAPEEDLAEVAEVPAVADDPVVGRLEPGQQRRLDGARDRGQRRVDPRLEPLGGDRPQAGHVLERARREADRVDQDQGHRISSAPRATRRSRVQASSAARPSTSPSSPPGPSGRTPHV